MSEELTRSEDSSETIKELKSMLEISERNRKVLEKKLDTEIEENKGLRLTLALRTDHELERARSERNPTVEDLEIKLVVAEKEILVIESTNKELLNTLNTTRSQLSKIVRDRNQKEKEIEQLEELLEKMGKHQSSERSCAASMQYLADELNGQALQWKTDKDAMTKRFEETESTLKKEIESLKSQKEDIENHANNSERMYKERLRALTSDVERLQSCQRGIGFDVGTRSRFAAEIDELNRKLADALDAIEEVEEANSGLREQLETADAKLAKLNEEFDRQKGIMTDELEVHLTIGIEMKMEMENLKLEVKKLESIRDSQAKDLTAITEKHTKQTIKFSNEKAKFCHDMERVEEKWNNEVVKLREENQNLDRMVFKMTKVTLDETETHKKEVEDLRHRIEELDSLLKVQQTLSERQIEQCTRESQELKDQLAVARQDIVKECDDECAELETEIYQLMDKRKTEAKKLRTMAKKNIWLTKSIRRLSEQRRGEIKAKDLEIEKLHSLCDLHRMEKGEWLRDLKQDVNAWKDEMCIRMSMKEQIEQLQKEIEEIRAQNEELQKENDELDEKVESVTSLWRNECDEHKLAVEKHRNQIQWHEKREHELRRSVSYLGDESDNLERLLEKQQKEATDLQKATVELSKMEMDNLKTLMEMQKSELAAQKDTIIHGMEKKMEMMKKTAAVDTELLKNTIVHWQNEASALGESRAIDRLLWINEVEQLKEANQKLKENLGVETLDDVEVTSESSSDSELIDSDEEEEEEEEEKKEEWEMVEDDVNN